MSMYDVVRVPCPGCGTREEFQTKSGDCNLDTYDLESCPADVLAGVNRHAPGTCVKCGLKFYVAITAFGRAAPWPPPGYKDDEPEDPP